MKLSLCIRVYKGGKLWDDCWSSVVPLAHYFHEIIVSINKTEFQEIDHDVLKNQMVPNVKIFVQQTYLPAVPHLTSLFDHLTGDHVLFLCHDDILLEAGLKQAIEILETQREPVSLFGSFKWSETTDTFEGVTRELSEYPQGAPLSNFLSQDIRQPYNFSLSGLATPIFLLKKYRSLFSEFQRGFKVDNLIVTLPEITALIQTKDPLVKIQLHDDQDGRVRIGHEFQQEAMTYDWIQLIYSTDFSSGFAFANKVLRFAYKTPALILPLLKLCFLSTSWPGNKHFSSTFFKIGMSFALLPAMKLKKFLKKSVNGQVLEAGEFTVFIDPDSSEFEKAKGLKEKKRILICNESAPLSVSSRRGAVFHKCWQNVYTSNKGFSSNHIKYLSKDSLRKKSQSYLEQT